MSADKVLEAAPKCVRCGRPVVIERARYDVFERMHWICFHLEFEHVAKDPSQFCDPDEVCADPSCPWKSRARFDRYEAKLRALGVDPESL